MAKSHKDDRIWKLWIKGLTVEQIARKIGQPNDLERVKEAILRRAAEVEKEAFKSNHKNMWEAGKGK